MVVEGSGKAGFVSNGAKTILAQAQQVILGGILVIPAQPILSYPLASMTIGLSWLRYSVT